MMDEKLAGLDHQISLARGAQRRAYESADSMMLANQPDWERAAVLRASILGERIDLMLDRRLRMTAPMVDTGPPTQQWAVAS